MSYHELFKNGDQYNSPSVCNTINEYRWETSRSGIISCTDSDTILIRLNLIKEGGSEYDYRDYFENDYFQWDSQNSQDINTPLIQKIISGSYEILLFIRMTKKIGSNPAPWTYCGRIEYDKYDKNSAMPVSIRFLNIDYQFGTSNPYLREIYEFNPSEEVKNQKKSISAKNEVSPQRRATYKKPNKTERKGLVTTRVGQGPYREDLISKWNCECAITGINNKSILIASHIKRWKDSNSDERLDVDNGILLSPNFDALFDRHLISFDDDGFVLVNNTSIGISNCELIGMNKFGEIAGKKIKINVNEGMKKYLKEHRKIFRDKL